MEVYVIDSQLQPEILSVACAKPNQLKLLEGVYYSPIISFGGLSSNSRHKRASLQGIGSKSNAKISISPSSCPPLAAKQIWAGQHLRLDWLSSELPCQPKIRLQLARDTNATWNCATKLMCQEGNAKDDRPMLLAVDINWPFILNHEVPSYNSP